ncbi:chymotrypsin-2-like [Stomoxys calcitrans]|uniref:chymotrypsin-2-like n=1 Tax=Stomoxys calcitrans TaxID=35570 RepID=UPI0027E36987|nr:chymotrypsin-2-like [Stomoxys calcitrans]
MVSYGFFIVTVTAFLGSVSCFPDNRVVNGTDSDVTQYPFIVSMRGPAGSHLCGASIIAPRWILTAAHCVSGRVASQLSIQYGSTMISVNSTNVVGVKRIIMHENYNPAKSFANDIALLELTGSLIYNYKTMAPVTLPDPYYEIDQVPEGAPGVLAGWGLNSSFGSVQFHLQSVELKIYSDDECQLRHDNVTTADQLCGGVDEGGKGQCSGDSGGPLVHNGSIQLGIVSWSIKPCTVAPYPGVYTKVSHYVDWIYENMQQV